MSLMIRVADKEPAMCGANCTEIASAVPGETLAGRPGAVTINSDALGPDNCRSEIFRFPFPMLLMKMSLAVLVVFSACCPKSRDDGLRRMTAPVPVPLPVRGIE